MPNSFQNPDGTFDAESAGGPVRIVNVGTVASATVTMKAEDRSLYINNSGTTLGTLTVKLPMKVQAGETVDIAVGANVATLAIQTGLGVAVTGAPTSINHGTAKTMRYVGIPAGSTAAVGWSPWR